MQKFRIWLGLPLGLIGVIFFSGELLSNLARPVDVLENVMFIIIVAHVALLSTVIVHERGIRFLGFLKYHAARWDEIENIMVGSWTFVHYKDGEQKRFYTGAVNDSDDKLRFIKNINQFAPDLNIKEINEDDMGTRKLVRDKLIYYPVAVSGICCLVMLPHNVQKRSLNYMAAQTLMARNAWSYIDNLSE